jgi:hypothetical protein
MKGKPQHLYAAWALDTFKVMQYMTVKYTGKGKGKDLLDSYGLYFKEPMPERNSIVDFDDASILIDRAAPGVGDRTKQLPKSAANDCCFQIDGNFTRRGSRTYAPLPRHMLRRE